MKKLILFLLLLAGFTAQSQVYQKQASYGVQWKRLKIDSAIHIPTFCGVPDLLSVVGDQAAIAVDSCNKKLYFYDPKDSTWNIVSGGSVIIEEGAVDSVTYAENTLCQWIDGVSTCYQLNKFFDSVSVNWDGSKTVYYNNGVAVDSIATLKDVYVESPIYADGDTLKFKNDSLPLLTYHDGVDTSGTNDMDIPVKKWVLDRIVGGGGGGLASGSITWPGTLYSTPTTGSVVGSAITFSPSLASQSAYTLFGRGSGSGSPSFLTSIDSNWVTGLHTENYYNTKYLGSSLPSMTGNSGKWLTTNGTIASWATNTGGPVGSVGEIQFNKSGVFGSDTTLAYDTTSKQLKVGAFRIGGATVAGIGGLYSNAAYGMFIQGAAGATGDFALADRNSLVRLSVNSSGDILVSNLVSSFRVTTTANYDSYRFTAFNGGGFGGTTGTNASFPVFENNAIGIISGGSGTNPLYFIGGKISFEIGNGTNSKVAQFAPTTGNFMLQNGGTYTDATTAIFQATSTTKGTLITRMTKTQRNAIASPAAGLMVIVTGETGGEYLSWYNSSTSGWVKVSSVAD